MGDRPLAALRDEALGEIARAATTQAVEQIRVRYLGRKGELTQLLRSVPTLPVAERPEAGRRANRVKAELEEALEGRLAAVGEAERRGRLAADRVDLTLPGRRVVPGSVHPLTRVLDEIIDVFLGLGFQVAEGPEVELDYYNFEALNIPKDHPARDGFDTFYIEAPYLVRSHTSPVQIRTMKARKPPIRVIAPGKVFRPDKPDAGHSPMFHQIEGLIVGPGITFAHLKGVLDLFAKSMWGEKTNIRFRPSFFPFTEPSAEVDVSCFICGAKGCPVCKGSGWVEILGSGMVHPKVLQNCGIDAEANTGFAFGMGVERITMLKYGIPDIRRFYENHFAFLRQF
jgi:phenylalanyl-tRNA synthetase alpha chain